MIRNSRVWIPIVALLAGLHLPSTMLPQDDSSSTSSPPYADAVGVIDFTNPEHLSVQGAVILGSDAAKAGERALGARFDGGRVDVTDGAGLALSVEGELTVSARVFLEGRYFALDDRRGAVLMEWMGRDADDTAARHAISLEILNIGFVSENAYIGFWVDNVFLNVSLKKLRPHRWYDMVLRVRDGEGQLMIDGVARSPWKDLERGLAGNDRAVEVVPDDFLVFGTNRRSEYPFIGSIARTAFWNRQLSDDELKSLFRTEKLVPEWTKPADWHTNWAGFYEEDISQAEAFRRLYEDYERFYARALREDPYFPRFHITTAGFMTEPSASSYYQKDYHLFPHGCNTWHATGVTYSWDHYWNHLMSEDLVNWKIMPYPGWTRVSAGNIIETPKGAFGYPAMTEDKLAYEKWVSRDEKLARWELEKPIYIPLPPAGVFPKDNYIFRHEDRWYMLGTYAGHTRAHPETRGRVELYRAKDAALEIWEYVGLFYQGEVEIVHHPRIFIVDGKAVMDSDTAVDEDAWYVLGRIEDNRFIREGGGKFLFDQNWSWGQTITEPGGRVLRWSSIRNLTTSNNLVSDTVRRGWGNVYSIPRRMRIHGSRLFQEPVEEMEELRRGALFQADRLQLPENHPVFPLFDGKRGQIEVRCRLDASETVAGLLLQASDEDKVVFSFDGRTSEAVLDFLGARDGGRHGKNGLHATLREHLPVAPGGEIDLRLFYDRSVIEVYVNGLSSAGRWYPDNPEDVQVAFFSERDGTVLRSVEIWELGTIWGNYSTR